MKILSVLKEWFFYELWSSTERRKRIYFSRASRVKTDNNSEATVKR